MSSIGHNSGEIGGIAADALRQFFSRIQRLEEEKKAIQADIKDVFDQARSHGYDVKIMRKALRLMKMDAQERQEEADLLDIYMAAAGE